MKNTFAIFSIIIGLNVCSAQAPVKKVLIEKAASASTGFSIGGDLIMTDILTNYPNVIGLSYHTFADSMVTSETSDWGTNYVFGVPQGFVDRRIEAFGGGFSPNTWEDTVISQLIQPGIVHISFDGSYNEITRELNISVISNFETMPNFSDLQVNLVLVEDSVIISGTGYNQVNPFNASVGHPYYNSGDPIVGYVHRNVVRKMFDSWWGNGSVIPNPPLLNQDYIASYNYNIPSEYNEEQLSLVAFITYDSIFPGNAPVINANNIELLQVNELGLSVTTNLHASIYPNPFNNNIHLKINNLNNYNIQLLDSYGRVILSDKNTTSLNTEVLSSGSYILRIYDENYDQRYKLVKR